MAQLQASTVAGTLTTTGNVGIGTNSPSRKLIVYDTDANVPTIGLRTDGSGATDGFDLQFASSNTFLFNRANGYMAFGTGNTERMRIDSGGNVGIGLTNPAFPLTIYGSSFAASVYQTSATGTGGSNGFYVGHSNSISYVWNYNNFPLVLATNNTERVRILSGGNVGIGTTSPLAILDVYQAGQPQLRVRGTTGANHLYQDSTTGTTINDGLFVGIGGDQTGYIYHYEANPLVFATSNAERMRILAGGNVGIGSTNPAYVLDVTAASQHVARFTSTTADNGGLIINKSNASYNPNIILQAGGATKWFILNNSGDSDKFQLYEATGASPRFTLTQGGLVGIGTTNPLSLIHINGSEPAIRIVDTDDSSTSIIGSSGGYTYIRPFSRDFRVINAAGVGLLTVNPGGNVGIGLTTPSSLLHIYGSGNTFTRYTNTTSVGHYVDMGANSAGESFVYSYGAYPLLIGTNGTTQMTVLSGGNVGIGITNPGGLLTVNGTATPQLVLAGTWSGNHDIVFAGGSGNSTGGNNNTSARIRNVSSAPGGAATGTLTFTVNSGDSLVDAMYIKQDGNVGIGTTSPASLLTIFGAGNTLRLDSSSGADKEILMRSVGTGTGTLKADGNLRLWSEDSGRSIIFKTFGGESVIDSSGNVGIGTTSPATKLHVNNTSGTGLTLSNTVTSLYAEMRFQSANSSAYIFKNSTGYTSYGGANALNLFNEGQIALHSSTVSNIMYLTANGNVGINTTTPTSKLQFSANNSAADAGSKSYAGSAINTVGGDIATGRIFFQGYQQGTTDIVGFNNETNRFVLYNYTDTQYLQMWEQSGTTYLVPQGGDVGVGTTGPSAKLHVVASTGGSDVVSIFEGTGNLGVGIHLKASGPSGNTWRLLSTGTASTPGANNFGIYSDSAGLYRLIVNSSGNVGIGITNPARKLDVLEDSVQILANFQNTSTVSSRIKFTDANTGAENVNIGATGTSLAMWTNNTVRMTILSGGSVGIGITTPTAPLDTNGVRLGRNWAIAGRANIRLDSNGTSYPADILFGHTAAANQTSWTGVYWSLSSRAADNNNLFTIWRGAGNPGGSGEAILFAIQPGGNVGIGTTSPIGKLQIGGTSGNLLTVGTLTNDWGGDVAIGVRNGNGVIISKINTANDTNRVLVFYRDDTNGATIFGYTPSGGSTNVGFQFRASGVSYFNGGNVGIGVTNPSAKLHVNGTLRVDSSTSFTTEYGAVPNAIIGNIEDEKCLGTPDEWLAINVSGTDYAVPLFSLG
jgi:hypothetical protein